MLKKEEFIESELWILAWNASVQRAKIYKKEASPKDKSRFRKRLIKHLENEVIHQYKRPVSEKKHLQNIKSLIEFANRNGKLVLSSGYKYGVAQKLLNLGLKYYWCRGLIKEPPHCPVDRLILEETNMKGQINWTAMTSENEYLEAISAIRTKAKEQGKSLALFELEEFSRR